MREKDHALQAYFGPQYFFNPELEFRQTSFSSIEEIAEYKRATLDMIGYAAPAFHDYYVYRADNIPAFALPKPPRPS